MKKPTDLRNYKLELDDDTSASEIFVGRLIAITLAGFALWWFIGIL